ncbi:Phage integrase family protein [Mariprofundus aestuarium]|uniref:Phage integrase family protein n=1 Tax=Mariprofundus aestuarium TaxID=1921086 RepID=A0A2K8KXI3_MARES|nr:site-specific integrase [Mariprofundus aestuarium]ATX79670.1 Phage integrase family protein [Mariprofundus aestuarium]
MKEIRHSKRKVDNYLHDVLNRLNEMGISDAALPIIPNKKPRKLVLTKKENEFIMSGSVTELRRYFWDYWLKSAITADHDQEQLFAFAVAFSSSCEASFGKPIIYSMLAELKPSDLMTNFSFRTRVHPKDTSDNYSILYLPRSTQLLFASFLLKMAGWMKQPFLFFPDRERKRRSHAFQQIKEMYKKFKDDFKRNKPGIIIPETWESFGKVAPLNAVLNRRIGLEPYIWKVQSGHTLPTAHPRESSYALTRDEGRISHGLFQRQVMQLPHSGKTLSTVEIKELPVEKVDDIDWSGRSKLVIKTVCNEVKSVVKEHQAINSYGVKAKFHAIIENALQKADAITENQKSALHLALNWIRAKVDEKGIAGSTVCDYLNRVFYNGILNDPDSINIDEWESEDHELLFEDTLSRDSIKSEKTRRSIATPYTQAYGYGLEHGYFSDVNLKYIEEEWGGGTPRNELIGLSEFDSYIRIVMEMDDPSHFLHMLVVVNLMAFYGCLRSGEISRLTLKDLEISRQFLWINILKGKSASARRRAPFHLTAPEYALKIVSEYYDYRRKQFSDDANLKEIALFGPHKVRNRFTRSALSGEAIKLLQSYFGKSMVLHSLRHSGCSWLLLRMYSAGYPDLIESLTDEHHELFNARSIRNAAYLFSGELEELIPNYCGSSLIRLSKLMGHLGQQTTFRTYIHTFHVIQSHAMKRVSSVFGEEELTGATINALLPGKKSATTRASMKDKSINACLHDTYQRISKTKWLGKAFKGIVLSTNL